MSGSAAQEALIATAEGEIDGHRTTPLLLKIEEKGQVKSQWCKG